MERIGNIIQKYFFELGIDKSILEHRAISVWPAIVGKRLSEVTQPERVTEGKIFVKINNALWRNEIFYHKKKIIQKINQELGENVLNDIILI